MPEASDRVHGRGYGRCLAIDCVCASLSVDRCLMVSHQVCRVVALDRKKLIVVERCRSNHLVNNIVDAFRLMQERKCVCGEQPKIVNLQQELGRCERARFLVSLPPGFLRGWGGQPWREL